MKKKDLLKLIEAKYKIINNKEFIDELYFPKIDELKNEFEILKKEKQDSTKEAKKGEEIINSYNCDHPVRLIHYGTFWSTSYCVFCDKAIYSDNVGNWEYSKNRNKYCVTLDDREQDNEDYYYTIEDGYTINQVLELLLDIVKDKNDDDIDLIQEFKKLNLSNCKINEEHKINENYILILSGSNKQYITEDSFIKQNGLEIGFDFLDYFYGLLNTKIELIDNTDFLENKKFKEKISSYNDSVKITSYDTIEELIKKLNYQKEVPFKIIIDLSGLYNYKIENNSIIKEENDINLNEFFPNSNIIKIKNFSKEGLEKLSKFLKENINITNLYAYKDESYYHLEDNDINKTNLENTCNKIKKLLRN